MLTKDPDAEVPAQSETNIDIPAAADHSTPDVNGAGDAAKGVLADHKGKLAIGVAATLGIMIFYNWREKRLAKVDPEGHARLQRLKAVVRNSGAQLDFSEDRRAPDQINGDGA